MAIAKKPIKNKVNEDLTNAVINKGGGSPSHILDEQNNSIKITIRLTTTMLNIIDEYLKTSMTKKTRTFWVREAVEEKIKKDITKN